MKKDLTKESLPRVIDRRVDVSTRNSVQSCDTAEADDPLEVVLSLANSLASVDNYADKSEYLFSTS